MTVNGLPAHVLLVHAIVVLVPLSALLIVLVAVWAPARRRLALFTAAIAVVTVVLVPITTEAGDWLEHRLPRTALLRAHTHLGDDMLPWAIGLAVVALALCGRHLLSARRPAADSTGSGHQGDPGPIANRKHDQIGGRALTVALGVLAVLIAAGSVVTVYQIGDSGARAAWTGKFSPTALPRPPHHTPSS
jgi:hypothetical protein